MSESREPPGGGYSIGEWIEPVGATLLGLSGVAGLVLIATGNFSGYAQGAWGIATIIGSLILFYVE